MAKGDAGYHLDHRRAGYACTKRVDGRRCGRRGKWDGKKVRCLVHR